MLLWLSRRQQQSVVKLVVRKQAKLNLRLNRHAYVSGPPQGGQKDRRGPYADSGTKATIRVHQLRWIILYHLMLNVSHRLSLARPTP